MRPIERQYFKTKLNALVDMMDEICEVTKCETRDINIHRELWIDHRRSVSEYCVWAIFMTRSLSLLTQDKKARGIAAQQMLKMYGYEIEEEPALNPPGVRVLDLSDPIPSPTIKPYKKKRPKRS